MIVSFNEINKDSVLLAGGKAANLGELVKTGCNVPAGFVITANLYQNFIKQNGIDIIIAKELATAGNNQDKLLQAAAHFRELLKNGDFSPQTERLIEKHYNKLGSNSSVAVRSSATAEDLQDASFAGQQATYLNVQGIKGVLKQIRNCYASLWSERATAYRISQNYDQKNLAIAVVIQAMVESEKSGVLFTVNPVNNNQSEMLIDANYGLGESVVSGRVTADHYVIARSGKIIEANIGTKQTQIVYDHQQTKQVAVDAAKRQQRVLSDKELTSLMQLGLKIECHYGYPVDIEWAIYNKKIYILQARAITTLTAKPADALEIESYIKNVKIKKYNRELVSFLIEKIPFAFRALEYDYFTVVSDQKATIFAENGLSITSNLAIDSDGIMSIRREKMHLNRNIFKIFGTLKSLLDYDYCANYCRSALADYQTKVEQFKSIDFTKLTLSECKDFMINSYQLTKDISYMRFKYALFPALLNRDLTRAIKKVDDNYTSFDLYWGLANRTSLVANDIAAMAHYIGQKSDIKAALAAGLDYDELCKRFVEFKSLADDFLAKYGYISDYTSYCVTGKSFIEDSNRMVKILRPLVSEPQTVNRQIENKDFSEITTALAAIYGKKYQKLAHKIDNFRYFHIVREEGQYLYEVIFFYLRKCLKQINLLLLGDQNSTLGVANLFYEELIQILEKGHLDDMAIKKINRRNQRLPFAQKVWNAAKLATFQGKGDVLKGISGNGGVIVAKVCIVRNPQEFYKLQKGDVLVCPFTAPEWTPLFKLAGAVVADTGSALSHAAIVAREFAIPAVLGVGYATAKLKDGDMIKVDGDKGEVMGV